MTDSDDAGDGDSDEHGREKRRDIKRTQLAQHGLDVATLFAAKYLTRDVSSYQPKMRELGVSTEGGKQATQHIVLEPKVVGDPILTIGSANLATKTAKLRTYDCLEAMHKKRFRDAPFMLQQAAYQRFFDELLDFLRKYQLQVEIETRPPEVAQAPASRPARVGSGSWFALIVLVILGTAVAWAIYTGRLHLPPRR